MTAAARRAAAKAAVAHLAAPAAASGTAKQTDARLLVDGADIAVLRSLRRRTALRVSDEAIGEIEFLTELLRRASAKTR